MGKLGNWEQKTVLLLLLEIGGWRKERNSASGTLVSNVDANWIHKSHEVRLELGKEGRNVSPSLRDQVGSFHPAETSQTMHQFSIIDEGL